MLWAVAATSAAILVTAALAVLGSAAGFAFGLKACTCARNALKESANGWSADLTNERFSSPSLVATIAPVEVMVPGSMVSTATFFCFSHQKVCNQHARPMLPNDQLQGNMLFLQQTGYGTHG